jgi:hypothetical protein
METKLGMNSNEKEVGVKILGGFFIYRANPSKSSPVSDFLEEDGSSNGEKFGQTNEITGMVLIKQYGTRTYMAFESIDPEKKNISRFMTGFSDTEADNPFDNNKTNVFDIQFLPELLTRVGGSAPLRPPEAPP